MWERLSKLVYLPKNSTFSAVFLTFFLFHEDNLRLCFIDLYLWHIFVKVVFRLCVYANCTQSHFVKIVQVYGYICCIHDIFLWRWLKVFCIQSACSLRLFILEHINCKDHSDFCNFLSSLLKLVSIQFAFITFSYFC